MEVKNKFNRVLQMYIDYSELNKQQLKQSNQNHNFNHKCFKIIQMKK